MNANANVSSQPIGSRAVRNALIATLLVVVGGGAGFVVLGGERESDPPAEVQQAQPRAAHVASSAEWAPPISDEDAGTDEAP